MFNFDPFSYSNPLLALLASGLTFQGIDSPEPSNGTLRPASYFSAAFDFDGTFILSIWRVVPVNARGISSPIASGIPSAMLELHTFLL